MYVLDTDVLSQFALKRPNRQIINWLQNTTAGVAIPFGAVIEIERGISNIAVRDRARSEALRSWLQSLLESDIPFLGMDAAIACLYGRMTSVPPLKRFWVPASNIKKPKLGQDLSIAATAIVHAAPIASLNAKDFLYIHRFFRLPGLFNPQQERWLIPPVNGASTCGISPTSTPQSV
ncbi:hypothetical protein [Chelativorans sp. AA-79]|uniref:hypothetical protein n=1 Tax=Chelativorans sp. AA-79 TaxID=3028735 RepID=UPI0023F9EAC5|nr:hypothetical protein [Chelativorans sp. AA-79]WEX11686.1 hypothetical protein PVE73_12540 [Chelativorans sp. AA-79]